MTIFINLLHFSSRIFLFFIFVFKINIDNFKKIDAYIYAKVLYKIKKYEYFVSNTNYNIELKYLWDENKK